MVTWVIFNPKIHVADFCHYRPYFDHEFQKKIATNFPKMTKLHQLEYTSQESQKSALSKMTFTPTWEPMEVKGKRLVRREKPQPAVVTPKNKEMSPGDGQTRYEHNQVSYKSGSVFGKTPPSTTPVPTKPAAVDDSSDLVGGELKGGEEDEDIFPSSYPILGSSSTDIITVDDDEETPKQKIIPPRSTDI